MALDDINLLPDEITPDVTTSHDQHHEIIHAGLKEIKTLIEAVPSIVATTLPTADASTRGNFVLVTHDGGADTLHVCMYNGTDYVWQAVTTTNA